MTTTALSEVLAEIRENTSIMPGKYWADRIESALASAEPVLGWANPRDVEKVRRPRSKRDGSALAVFIHGEQSEDYSIPIYTHAKPAAKVEALCSDSDIADAISGLEEAYRFASTSPRAQEAINFAIEVMSRTAAPTPASDYPECSGDPASCPENEGHGCCKPNPIKTTASVPDSLNAVASHLRGEDLAEGLPDGWEKLADYEEIAITLNVRTIRAVLEATNQEGAAP